MMWTGLPRALIRVGVGSRSTKSCPLKSRQWEREIGFANCVRNIVGKLLVFDKLS